jgi:hypothetical protein
MAVPLWEIGRSWQLLSCKEMEINRQRTGVGAKFANTHESERSRLFGVDSRSVFFGYIDFTDTAECEEKQKIPYSYSRAEENARFARVE